MMLPRRARSLFKGSNTVSDQQKKTPREDRTKKSPLFVDDVRMPSRRGKSFT